MEFQNATISYKEKGKDKTIKVLFNPNEYRLNKANQFAEVAIPGLAGPPLQFVRGNARTLSMQLFFDTYTYHGSADVRDHTKKIVDLLKIDDKLHAPPICHFNWGKLNFIGVLERADQRFTLFLPDGKPVRATVDVSFKEHYEGAQKLESADFAKHYVVKRGDTLSSIAGEKYGDPGLWRPIAEKNSMDDPLALKPGQVLVIPAIE